MSGFVPARLQPVKDLPAGAGWLYEPKLDGYRGLLVSSPDGRGSIWSRNGKDLGRWFPELVSLAGRLPRATVLDGEIVMPTESGVSFMALQRRLALLGRESPVAFIAFDVLRRDEDLRARLLSERRRHLVRVVEDAESSALQLMTQTADLDVATAWLDPSVTLAGIEGVVAKLDEPYPKPEAKRWRKVRRVSTHEFAVRGFIPDPSGAVRLVLATIENEAHLVGTTYPIEGSDLVPLQALTEQASLAERRIWAPFDDGRSEWYELPPHNTLLAEVVVTTLDGGMLRQPARFVRWRFKDPANS